MPPASPVCLLRVAAAWPLPGLGLLVLPAAPTPALATYALHTALAVRAVRPDGAVLPGSATVEEVTRPGATTEPPFRSLLLSLEAAGPLPPGTAIYLADGPQ